MNNPNTYACCAMYCAFVAGFVIFLYGLISPTIVDLEPIPIKSLFEERPKSIDEELWAFQKTYLQKHYISRRRKVIIIVIDALRADFILSDKQNFNTRMNFTDFLRFSGKAISFRTLVSAPTVTLPRIKSLVTGTISNFLDIIINFNAAELTSDNLLNQASLFGLKSVFYGDDTWLKLFPNTFLRSEGTHSFFVSDFKEVDQNVSRHIRPELLNNDWNIMILHYLGVDHIGHAHSPYSEYLPKKLIEMDEVIKLIYESIEKTKPPSLIVVCGDHGMTSSGSHGGVTFEELLTPLIFIDTEGHGTLLPENSDTIDQVDFAPTLSILLGIPIPASNFGNIISDALHFIGFSKREVLFAAYYNFLQISRVYQQAFSRETYNVDLVLETSKKHLKWLKNSDKNQFDILEKEYLQLLNLYKAILSEMKSDLLSSISGYNEFSMQLGILIVNTISVLSINCIYSQNKYENNFSKVSYKNILKFSLIAHFPLVFLLYKKMYKEIIFIPVFTVLCLALNTSFSIFKSASKKYFIKVFHKLYFLLLVFHALSLFSSSFIEEEHQIWYFFTITIILLTAIKKFYNVVDLQLRNAYAASKIDFYSIWNQFSNTMFNTIMFLIIHRFVRQWNQVGNKWQHLPDISDWLNHKNNVIYLAATILLSQITIIIYFKKHLKGLNFALFLIGIVCITIQKVGYCTSLVTDYLTTLFLPWVVYILLILLTFHNFIQFYSSEVVSKKQKVQNFLISFISHWILLIQVIGRNHNIPVIAFALIEEYTVSKIYWTQDSDLITNTILYLTMFKTSFFNYGNSNSISTIDVYTGYTGITSYFPFIVASLLFCNTYSTAILWFLMLTYRILKFSSSEKDDVLVKIIKLTFFSLLNYKLLVLSLYCMVMYSMKHHLFIYSVFFPKLFYEIFHVMCFSIISIFVSFVAIKV